MTTSPVVAKFLRGITAESLAKDVVPVPGTDYSMVSVDSPIVEVIRVSEAELKASSHNVKITEGMVPVRNHLIDSVKQFLLENAARAKCHD